VLVEVDVAWRSTLELLLASSHDSAPEYESLQVFCEYLYHHFEPSTPVFRGCMFQVVRAWLQCIQAEQWSVEQAQFVEAVLLCVDACSSAFVRVAGLPELLVDSVGVFDEALRPNYRGRGFSAILSLCYAWPCARRLAMNVARCSREGGLIGLWLVNIFAPFPEPASFEASPCSTLQLIRPFARNGRTWLAENSEVVPRLLSPTSLTHLLRTSRDKLPSLQQPACDSLRNQLQLFGPFFAGRMGEFYTLVSTGYREHASEFWLDELR